MFRENSKNSNKHWNIFIACVISHVLCPLMVIFNFVCIDIMIDGQFHGIGITYSDGQFTNFIQNGKNITQFEKICPTIAKCSMIEPSGTDYPKCALTLARLLRMELLIIWIVFILFLIIDLLDLVNMILTFTLPQYKR